jgi:hypothetical protein
MKNKDTTFEHSSARTVGEKGPFFDPSPDF